MDEHLDMPAEAQEVRSAPDEDDPREEAHAPTQRELVMASLLRCPPTD